ncbi:MAG: Flp family type IVb pilin [Rickettsiales bacterium]
MKILINFLKDKNGATALEYALIIVLISIAIIFAATQVGKDVFNTFSTIASAIASSITR